MNEIPPIYWMIVIGVVTVMICLVLFYVAMLLLETKKTVVEGRTIMKDASGMLKQLELIINDVQSSVSTIRGTVEEVNQSILAPLRKLGNGVAMVTGFLGGILGRKEEQK